MRRRRQNPLTAAAALLVLSLASVSWLVGQWSPTGRPPKGPEMRDGVVVIHHGQTHSTEPPGPSPVLLAAGVGTVVLMAGAMMSLALLRRAREEEGTDPRRVVERDPEA